MSAIESSSLRGKTILVTGAGSGLGAAICELLSQEGVNLVMVDINADSTRKIAQKCASPDEHLTLAMDVGDEEQVAQVFAQARERFGAVDAVINNAAIDITVPIDELAVKDWERVLRTNLTGPFIIA